MQEQITKIRFFIDYEKEEKWVNEMSMQGWQLKKFVFCFFTFTKGQPNEYTYRNELLSGINAKDNSKQYISFLQETGVELVSKSFLWAYFRKKTSEGPFELYSDTTSKLQYLNRIYYIFLFLFIFNLFIGLINLSDFLGTESLAPIEYIGFLNLFVSFIMALPLYRIFKKRKVLKSQLEIFHD